MTASYLIPAALGALGFYLASAYQRLWPAARHHPRAVGTAVWLASTLALAATTAALGTWAGVFATSTALMLALVALTLALAHARMARATLHRGRHGDPHCVWALH